MSSGNMHNDWRFRWTILDGWYAGLPWEHVRVWNGLVRWNEYDDGEKEHLEFSNETWRLQCKGESLSAVYGTAIKNELKRSEAGASKSLLDHVWNNPFHRHQGQGIPKFTPANCSASQEWVFPTTFRLTPIPDVSSSVNVIMSPSFLQDIEWWRQAPKSEGSYCSAWKWGRVTTSAESDYPQFPLTGFKIMQSLAPLI